MDLLVGIVAGAAGGTIVLLLSKGWSWTERKLRSLRVRKKLQVQRDKYAVLLDRTIANASSEKDALLQAEKIASVDANLDVTTEDILEKNYPAATLVAFRQGKNYGVKTRIQSLDAILKD